MNPLQLMNTLREEVVCNDFNQGLMVTTVLVDEREVRAMLDTGATANFLASHEVARLGLKVTVVGSKVKAVNSASVSVQGAVQSSLQVGTWQKIVKFTVMPLDDFDLILGMEFFMVAMVQLMPYRKSILIMGMETPCIVSFNFMVHGISEPSLHFAGQFVKGLKRNENSYLAALLEKKHDHVVEVPDEYAQVLEEFADVMPPKLPQALPPKRAVDHWIDLEPGVRPPAQDQYRMSPSKWVELYKQLDELLDAEFIQPSKAPYGAPILFQRK